MDVARRFVCLIVGMTLLWAGVAAVFAEPLDVAIPKGHFFKQANGLGGAGPTGFAVVDDDQARFWSAFQRLGGVGTLGYPVSRRFIWDGFLVQAFQKVVFQWRPEVQQVDFLNVFDRLSAAGMDAWLDSARSTPPSFDNAADAGLARNAVVARHLAVLDVNPAIKSTYLSDSNPVLHYGLPMSSKDYGNVFVVRAQRAVFQQWKTDVTWAKAGEVVIANGGDIAKEAGQYPLEAAAPQTQGDTFVLSLVAGPNTTSRLYLLVERTPSPATGGPSQANEQLLVSDDAGKTWQSFSGGLPEPSPCPPNVITMDYATPDALYFLTCQGIDRWTGRQWEPIASGHFQGLAVTYGQPQNLWAVAEPRVLVHSVDGGRTWNPAGLTGVNGDGVAIDPRNPNLIYAMGTNEFGGLVFWRSGGNGTWAAVPPPLYYDALAGMTLDGATGAIYVIENASHSASQNDDQLWRQPNPDAPYPGLVRADLIRDFGPNTSVFLRASGRVAGSLALYATFDRYPPTGDDSTVLGRSLDGGVTWQALPTP